MCSYLIVCGQAEAGAALSICFQGLCSPRLPVCTGIGQTVKNPKLIEPTWQCESHYSWSACYYTLSCTRFALVHCLKSLEPREHGRGGLRADMCCLQQTRAFRRLCSQHPRPVKVHRCYSSVAASVSFCSTTIALSEKLIFIFFIFLRGNLSLSPRRYAVV